MSSAPTAKLQPTSTNEPDPAQTSKPTTNTNPATLEEDDEFEDFPVEGTPPLPAFTLHWDAPNHCRQLATLADMIITDWAQEDTENPTSTTGGNTHLWRRAGTTMTGTTRKDLGSFYGRS
ncbi:uncharacterized protein AB675_4911 [Cyphellophora attinorum]|uniref:Uncharacterized protein n=1 Tax=Cyphellophora attinorum TaxID=1664694 RepID=A0A0N0NHS2_9EURO|nr:uncharacterized protein AB675_4911 [Phialophora attinorum]KPI34599.1 hypothetical protein AB675_4911 [Phialophora attinorum]